MNRRVAIAQNCPRSVVVPTLNEESYVRDCLLSLLPQLRPVDELLVVDGGSTDRTVEIVEAMQAEWPSLRLVRNEKRTQAAAVNLAASVASPESRIIVRADAHSSYPPGYVECCVEAMEHAGATSVVVPMRAIGRTPFQRAVAAAQNSRLGNGAAIHRTGGESRFVDHGHHAAFDRSFFAALGGYDERFTHNEDAELDLRALLHGGRIWMCAEATIDYYPRRRAWPLAKQYFNFGRGRMRTLLKHDFRPKLRQMLPVFLLASLVAAFALGPIVPEFLAFPAAYAILCTGWGAALAWKERDLAALMAGPAAMIMHLAWAVGFGSGAAQAILRRRVDRAEASARPEPAHR